MKLKPAQIQAWQDTKAAKILPIIYVRGFAATDGEIDETTADPFNGFNIGSVLLRTGWTGDSARHIFESPVLRLMQPPYNYRLTFSDGVRGLNADAKADLAEWASFLQEQDAKTLGSPLNAVIAIYRYYDIDSHLLGEGVRLGMETYGWGLCRLVLDILKATGAAGVYLVAHSMGGLVARTFLQNETVLDDTNPSMAASATAVAALIKSGRAEAISQNDWTDARRKVRKFFTYGTPHNGISGQGGYGNSLIGVVGSLAGLEIGNFAQANMAKYLNTPQANSLNGKYPIENVFCLVGTGAADYPVADGFARRLVGQMSDGLVEVDNAVVCGPSPTNPGQTILAARAYVQRAHSGPYGMVNSEEGFGNLTRFLFGNKRVDCTLIPVQIDLPTALQTMADRVKASYSFESLLRVRGETWAMTQRLVRDGSAAFRRYDEMFPNTPAPAGLSEKQLAAKPLHRTIGLFTAFLDTQLRSDPTRAGELGGLPLRDSLGFALRLRVAVPDYEVDGILWTKDHYEGSSLIDTDLVFLTFPNADGGWQLAWGVNSADSETAQLALVRAPDNDATAEAGTQAFRRVNNTDQTLEFWLPISSQGAPCFRAWLRLTARQA